MMSQGQLAFLMSSSSLVIFDILGAFFSKNVLISTLVLIFEKKKNNTYYYSFRKYIKANYRDKIGELLNLSNCNDEKKKN